MQSVEHVRLQTWGNHNPKFAIGELMNDDKVLHPSFVVRC